MGKGGKRRGKGRRRRNRTFVGAWVPASLVETLEKAVRTSHLDHSTFLRQALEEKVERHFAAGRIPTSSPLRTRYPRDDRSTSK
jgi:hypothetical protein